MHSGCAHNAAAPSTCVGCKQLSIRCPKKLQGNSRIGTTQQLQQQRADLSTQPPQGFARNPLLCLGQLMTAYWQQPSVLLEVTARSTRHTNHNTACDSSSPFQGIRLYPDADKPAGCFATAADHFHPLRCNVHSPAAHTYVCLSMHQQLPSSCKQVACSGLCRLAIDR